MAGGANSRRRESHGNAWIVVGKFHGRGGPTLLEMSVAAPAFSEESVTALLESIH